MEHQPILSLLKQSFTLSRTDEMLLKNFFEPFDCAGAQMLIEIGKPARYMYFVNEGFARAFHMQEGTEVTNHLTGPRNFITAFHSFTSKMPSDECVQAITPCQMLRITRDNLSQLYRRSHTMALFGIAMSEKYLLFNNQRGKDFVTLNAEQRYVKLMKEDPGIIHNVPLQFIASYLGIQPQTLSRIRRKIIS